MKKSATNKELLECIKLCRLARKYIPVGTYNGTNHTVTLLNRLPELLDDLERRITEEEAHGLAWLHRNNKILL